MKKISYLYSLFIYLLFVFSAAFLNVPMLGILAMPLLLISGIALLIIFLSLHDEEVEKKLISTLIITIGTILLIIIVGYTAIQYTEYLLAIRRGVVERFFPSPWLGTLKIMGTALIASITIVVGIKLRSGWSNKRLFFIFLVIFSSVFLTTLIVKILELMGVPLSA